jgi:hypothetical protein
MYGQEYSLQAIASSVTCQIPASNLLHSFQTTPLRGSPDSLSRARFIQVQYRGFVDPGLLNSGLSFAFSWLSKPGKICEVLPLALAYLKFTGVGSRFPAPSSRNQNRTSARRDQIRTLIHHAIRTHSSRLLSKLPHTARCRGTIPSAIAQPQKSPRHADTSESLPMLSSVAQ